MRKVNQSGRKLHESDLKSFVNHAQDSKDLNDLIEEENEKMVKKIKKEVDYKLPSYEEVHYRNDKF